MNIEIRKEVPSDVAHIEALTTVAFLNAPHTSHTEQLSDNKLFVAFNTLVSLIQKPFKSFTIGVLGQVTLW